MELHEAWIFKADHDFRSAEILFANALNDTAIYHAQQCAEKSLKAYLVFKNVAIPKTHSLDKLLDLCKQQDGNFDKIDVQVFDLEGFDVRFRYPAQILEPLDEEVDEAIISAEVIFEFVKERCV